MPRIIACKLCRTGVKCRGTNQRYCKSCAKKVILKGKDNYRKVMFTSPRKGLGLKKKSVRRIRRGDQSAIGRGVEDVLDDFFHSTSYRVKKFSAF